MSGSNPESATMIKQPRRDYENLVVGDCIRLDLYGIVLSFRVTDKTTEYVEFRLDGGDESVHRVYFKDSDFVIGFYGEDRLHDYGWEEGVTSELFLAIDRSILEMIQDND